MEHNWAIFIYPSNGITKQTLRASHMKLKKNQGIAFMILVSHHNFTSLAHRLIHQQAKIIKHCQMPIKRLSYSGQPRLHLFLEIFIRRVVPYISKSYILQYLKMRKFFLFAALVACLTLLTHSAIIITSSMPKIYQINNKQNLIVFDQPSDEGLAQAVALAGSTIQESEEEEPVSPPRPVQGIVAAPSKSATESVKSQQSTKDAELASGSNLPSSLLPPISSKSSQAGSSGRLNSDLLTQPVINIPSASGSTNQPTITSSPLITASSPSPLVTQSQSVASTPKGQTSTTFSSTSMSYSSTTQTHTITTNFGTVSSTRSFKQLQMTSSFGSIGHRSDQAQYRKLMRKHNLDWISAQKQLSFMLAENQFTHLTLEEFRQLYLTLEVPSFVPAFEIDFKAELKRLINIDDSLINDWFGSSYVNPKKNNNKPAPTPTPSPAPTPAPAPSNSSSNSSSNSTSKNSTSNNSTSNSTNNSTTNNSTKNNSTNNNSTSNNATRNNSTSNSTSNNSTNNSTSNSTSSNRTTSNSTSNNRTTSNSTSPNSTVVLNVDWTASGMVTPIRDQGSCGGCYAFATNAALQSAFLMRSASTHAGINLSVQQILDCSSNYGNKGCNGGWMESTLRYIKASGITTESQYPYTQVAGSCKMNGGAFKVSSYAGGALNDCSSLAAMVAGRPTSVAVYAGNNFWKYYSGGILNQCGSGNIDHGVLLVGVFQNATQNYWKIKNSWGTSWGENGYIRIDRSVAGGNLCEICSYGFYPIL